ncbi:alpha/beta hydrolase [Longimicrobium sp.]|uniref:alpha/beta hydrolase n=1 Tax=Longimicrobium sp. TaxID=2029185 RepID=UPI002E2FF4A6|nr:alpha/beta hydrolase [Longimicrobium sp.]HEX6037284.1 alpha/beta hydrolase [Longimicrobium sp.]
MRPSRLIPLVPLAAALLAAAGTDAQTPAWSACTNPNLPADARCGTLQVPENREQPGGRQLSLAIIVIPGRGLQPIRQAMTFFGGGPGQAASSMAPWIWQDFDAVREGRDLVFVDQRGTGSSSPLVCNLRDPANPQSYLDDFLPPARAAACRDSLATFADLTRYGFPEMAHDTEAWRRALGYDRLDLWGGSYGTRAALVYLRMYPQSVRSVVLEGVVPFGFLQPRDYARDMDAALAGLFAKCRADAACNGAFPDVAAELRAVADRIRQGPVTAEIRDRETGRMTRLSMSYGTFAETLRKMMYDPGMASTVPFVVHRAFEGDYRPLIRYGLGDRRGSADSSWGLYLALTCSEDVPFIDQAAAAAENGRTLLGDYRVRQQAAACEGWPRHAVAADYHQPLRSDAPVLLISGELDPVTPASGGTLAARTLPNSLHVIVPGGAHGSGGMNDGGCVQGLLMRFVQQASVRGLDTACVAGIRRPPFVIDIPEAVAVDPAVLARLAGTYVATGDRPLRATVEAIDGGLRIRGDDGFEAVALPISPTRFLWDGGPGTFGFEFSDDATTLTVRANGPPMVLVRRP